MIPKAPKIQTCLEKRGKKDEPDGVQLISQCRECDRTEEMVRLNIAS